MRLRLLLLAVARGLGAFALCRWLTRRQLRILCYHGIWLGPQPHYGDHLFMSAGRFERRMTMLSRRGYRVRPLADAVQRWQQGLNDPRDVVLTIDDGWQGTERHMLPLLQQRGWPATLYIPTHNVVTGEPVLPVLVGYLVARTSDPARRAALETLVGGGDAAPRSLDDRVRDWVQQRSDVPARRLALERVAEVLGVDLDGLLATGAFSLMTPASLRAAAICGIDVQLHTHTHAMHDMDAQKVGEEIERNRSELASALSVPPTGFKHFCYPSGEHRPEVFPVLERHGVQTATTTEFGLVRQGGSTLALPRILDGESLHDIELEARLSGLWSLLADLRRRLRRSSAVALAH